LKDVPPVRTLDRGENARPNHLLVTRAATTLEGSDDILENIVGELIESAFGLKEPPLLEWKALGRVEDRDCGPDGLFEYSD